MKALHEGRRPARIASSHVARVERILTVPDQSRGPEGMDLPGFRLHALRGPRKGQYAVSVSGNWRVAFRLAGGHAVDVDYPDYH